MLFKSLFLLFFFPMVCSARAGCGIEHWHCVLVWGGGKEGVWGEAYGGLDWMRWHLSCRGHAGRRVAEVIIMTMRRWSGMWRRRAGKFRGGGREMDGWSGLVWSGAVMGWDALFTWDETWQCQIGSWSLGGDALVLVGGIRGGLKSRQVGEHAGAVELGSFWVPVRRYGLEVGAWRPGESWCT